MPLSELINDFLTHLELERHASQLTVRNYRHYLKRFLEFSNDIAPQEIDIHLIKKYQAHLSRRIDPQTKQSLKRVTRNYFMIAVRAFLKYLLMSGITTLSPEKVELGAFEPRTVQVLNETQIKQLLAAPDPTDVSGLRDRAVMETLFSTGLLVSELVSLNRDTIDLPRKEFGIRGKGGKERAVFLSDSAVESFKKYLSLRQDTFKPLFIRFQGKESSENGGEAMRLTCRSIERIVEKYVKALGFSIKATPHTLRHGCAADLLTNGADICTVQEMLGHAHVATTQIYTHVTDTCAGNQPERV